MALTRSFKETVVKRAKADPAFRYALLQEALDELLNGDLDVAKTLLRDYINAYPNFSLVAKKMHKNEKSIQRMLGPSGNPTAASLTLLLKVVRKIEGVKFEVRVH